MLRSSTVIPAGKRPFGGLIAVAEEEEQEEPHFASFLVVPDVGAYLASFRNLSDLQQIAICRGWANYLAAKNRPSEYKKKKPKQ